jgi:hypothetical protein
MLYLTPCRFLLILPTTLNAPMNTLSFSGRACALVTLCSALFCLAPSTDAAVFVSPPKGATGISATAPVVFTFDISMDDLQTDVTFMDMANIMAGPLPVHLSWNGPYTVLTCTPLPSWPAGKQITWFISGETLDMEEVADMGTFTVGGSGGGGGSGTNALTTVAVGKLHNYVQDSSGSPVLDTANQPYVFQAITALASNRTANTIAVTAPGGASYNLSSFPTASENWHYADWQQTSVSGFDAKYPAGNYTFNLISSSGTESRTASLPVSMAQPNAPRIANYAAAQSVDAASAFTLSWDPFQAGTAADHISVSIGSNYESPDYDQPNALRGAATSVVIPAGTLQPGNTYTGTIMFIRQTYQTNDVWAQGA